MRDSARHLTPTLRCAPKRAAASRTDRAAARARPGSGLLLVGGLALLIGCTGIDVLPEPLRPNSRHQRYAKILEQAGLAESNIVRAWAAAADAALRDPVAASLPLRETLYFDPAEPMAYGYRLGLKLGQRLSARVEFSDRGPKAAGEAPPTGEFATNVADAWFLDLFRLEDSEDDEAPEVVRLAEAEFDPATGQYRVEYEVRRDGDFALRLQPEVLGGGRATLEVRADGVLTFPVSGGRERDIGSRFGDPRDAGARRHEGVDIFSPRGTPAVAAGSGRIRRVGTNRLGGNTVWMRTDNGLSLYYAHLDSQSVRTGQRVEAGEEVGRVGNSGNARTTPPHLHFGVYRGGAVDPSPFLARSTEPEGSGLPMENLGSWRRTRSSTVNLRSGPGTDNRVVGRIPAFTAAWVEGIRGGWYRVRLGDGRTGYLAGSTTESTDRPLRRIELAEQAELFRQPFDGSVRVAPVPRGEEVSVLAISQDAHLVRAPGGKIGWLAAGM